MVRRNGECHEVAKHHSPGLWCIAASRKKPGFTEWLRDRFAALPLPALPAFTAIPALPWSPPTDYRYRVPW